MLKKKKKIPSIFVLTNWRSLPTVLFRLIFLMLKLLCVYKSKFVPIHAMIARRGDLKHRVIEKDGRDLKPL